MSFLKDFSACVHVPFINQSDITAGEHLLTFKVGRLCGTAGHWHSGPAEAARPGSREENIYS